MAIPQPLPTEQFIGSMVVEPKVDTNFRIEAGNPSIENPIAAQSNESVTVFTPTPTPLPDPQVLVFDVQPTTVMAGDQDRDHMACAERTIGEHRRDRCGTAAGRQPGNVPTQNTTYLLRATTLGGDAFSQGVAVTVFPADTHPPAQPRRPSSSSWPAQKRW